MGCIEKKFHGHTDTCNISIREDILVPNIFQEDNIMESREIQFCHYQVIYKKL